MSALDTQIGGGHYKGMKIQPMEYSMANGLDACQHTAIKYISRFRDKGGIQDLEKAKHCIDMLIEFEQQKVRDGVEQSLSAECYSWIDHTRGADCPVADDKMVEVLYRDSVWSTWRAGNIDWLKVWRYRPASPAARLEVDETDPYGPRDAEGWYAWNGDETMRPAGEVFYVMRDGGKGRDTAELLSWRQGKNPDDIVKWRPAQ